MSDPLARPSGPPVASPCPDCGMALTGPCSHPRCPKLSAQVRENGLTRPQIRGILSEARRQARAANSEAAVVPITRRLLNQLIEIAAQAQKETGS